MASRSRPPRLRPRPRSRSASHRDQPRRGVTASVTVSVPALPDYEAIDAQRIVCTGPVLLSQAWAAAERIGDVALVALPWLRDVDGGWLEAVADGAPVVVLDNHVPSGGQGDAVRAALPGRRVDVLAVDGIPACGSNDEVLRHHGLDADSIAARVA